MQKKQQGMTMVSWIVVISFLGVVAIAALNIIPSYLNFMSAKSILDKLAEDSVTRGKSAAQIKGMVYARFRTNNLKNVDLKKALTLKNKGAAERAGYVINLSYEDRGKIMGNLYFVTVFEHEVEITP